MNVNIEFKPDRELQSYEDCCVACGWEFPKGTRTKECENCGEKRRKKRKDEPELRVIDNGSEESFGLESGGGKTMISLSVRTALTLLKRRQTGSEFNVLFLDEVDAMLDQENKIAFMNLVTKILIKKFGFEQIFWISHDSRISESTPHTLKVVRNGKYSKAGWL